MKIGQDLFDVTINVLKNIKKTLEKNNPDIVLVHGAPLHLSQLQWLASIQVSSWTY